MTANNQKPTYDEWVAYFLSAGITEERARERYTTYSNNGWAVMGRTGRAFPITDWQDRANRDIANSDAQWHVSNSPAAPPPPEAGTKLIPPSVWYAEMKREEARRLAEYEAIHGKAIPMPMHMRRNTNTKGWK